MVKITNVKAREIFDSRGNPTVETTVFLDNGISGQAAVPCGASKGTYEALELRDGDPKRYHGLGVLGAVDNIARIIAPKLKGLDPTRQKELDQLMIELDGTANKGRLGANSILSISLACARAAALALNLPLYEYLKKISANSQNYQGATPLFNVINGGLHGSGKFNFQEFLLIPNSARSYGEQLRLGVGIYQLLKENLKNKKMPYSIGDEGGFTPPLATNEQVLELIIETIHHSPYTYGKDVYLGIDLAASCFYQKNSYKLTREGTSLSVEEFLTYLKKLVTKFRLSFLEDPLEEDDWGSWQKLTREIGERILIIGDDLLVTNMSRLQKAIDLHACNGIIIKPNQIGTLTETLEVVKLAKEVGFKVIISHRSGETNDSFIADLAVGVGADFVKFGAPARGERVAKYNRLLAIYSQLG